MPSYHSSMESAINANIKICVDAPLESEMLFAHPKAHLVVWNSSNLQDVAAGLRHWRESDCDAVAYSLQEVQRTPHIAAFFCSMQLFAAAYIVSIPVAMPVRSDLAGSVSFFIEDMERRLEGFSTFDEQPFQTCADVIRPDAMDYDAIGSAADQTAAETAGVSRRRRLATGGAVGGAAALEDQQGVDSLTLRWTQSGGATNLDSKLHPTEMAAAVMVWLLFFGAAALRSLWEQRHNRRLQAISSTVGAGLREVCNVSHALKPSSRPRLAIRRRCRGSERQPSTTSSNPAATQSAQS